MYDAHSQLVHLLRHDVECNLKYNLKIERALQKVKEYVSRAGNLPALKKSSSVAAGDAQGKRGRCASKRLALHKLNHSGPEVGL